MDKKDAEAIRDVSVPKEQADAKELDGIKQVLEDYRTTMRQKREEILFLQGEDRYHTLMRRCLLYRGFDVESVVDEAQAYSYCVENKPKMVLIDIDLPLDAGWKLLKQIRGGIGNVLTIGVTSHLDSDTHHRALESGFDDVVTKPFNPRTFIDTIERHWCSFSNE